MKLSSLKSECELIEYIPELWRDDDEPPIVSIKVLTGSEVEALEEKEFLIERKRKKNALRGVIGIRDAILIAGIVKIEGLEDSDGKPVTTAVELIAALKRVDASVYDTVLSDLATAIRSHSRLKEGQRKN
jgi:hypothetical protein